MNFAITCKVCGTRMNAVKSQIGKSMRCPDCQSLTKVIEPPVEKKMSVMEDDDPDEYHLAEGSDQPNLPHEQTVSLICLTCHELLHAKVEDVGKIIRCNYCDAENQVPRPRQIKDNFVEPDVSDVHLDEAPPLTNAELKERAKERMNDASEYIDRRESEVDVMPKNPFITGVVDYPLYLEAMPICLGIGLGLMGIVFLWQALTSVMESGSLLMVGGAFLMNVISFLVIGLMLLVSPALLTIVEYAAVGRNKVEQFPSSELLERGYAALVIFCSAAFAAAPGIGLAMLLGLRQEYGLIGVPILFPIFLVSILEANSLQGFFNRDILASLGYAPVSWFQFISVTTLVGAVVGGIGYGILQLHATAGLVIGAILVGTFIVYYFRFLGRLAYVIVDLRPVYEEEEDADESEDA